MITQSLHDNIKGDALHGLEELCKDLLQPFDTLFFVQFFLTTTMRLVFVPLLLFDTPQQFAVFVKS